MEWYERKKGRPVGSKTKASTPGKKRAREFLDLMFDNDLRATNAASLISEKHGVETYQVFKDEKRHRDSIIADCWKEAEQTRRDYEALLSSTIGPEIPSDAKTLVQWVAATALRGQRIK